MGKKTRKILKTLERGRKAFRRYGVKRIALFGSQARGDAKRTSDIDFLVEFDRKTFDAYMDLKSYLERQFKCPVDLVTLESIKPRLRSSILREAIYAPGL